MIMITSPNKTKNMASKENIKGSSPAAISGANAVKVAISGAIIMNSFTKTITVNGSPGF